MLPKFVHFDYKTLLNLISSFKKSKMRQRAKKMLQFFCFVKAHRYFVGFLINLIFNPVNCRRNSIKACEAVTLSLTNLLSLFNTPQLISLGSFTSNSICHLIGFPAASEFIAFQVFLRSNPTMQSYQFAKFS